MVESQAWAAAEAANRAELLAYVGTGSCLESYRATNIAWVITGVPHDDYNGVIWARLVDDEAEQLPSILVDRFRMHQLPASWHLEVIPGFAGGQRPFGTFWASTVIRHPSWTGRPTTSHDIAVVKVAPANGAPFPPQLCLQPVADAISPSSQPQVTVAGYPHVVDSGATHVLKAELKQFYVEEIDTYKGDVRMAVTLTNAAGTPVWQGITEGSASRFGRSYKAENYYEALSDSLIEATTNLVRNPGFEAHELALRVKTKGFAFYAFSFTGCVKPT